MSNHQLRMIEVGGGVFQVYEAFYTDEGEPQSGSFTLRFNNNSGDWVDVYVSHESLPGGGRGTTNSGHVPNGTQGAGFTEPLSLYKYPDTKASDQSIEPCVLGRWRPGFLGIPGNGGADFRFRIPDEAVNILIFLNIIG